MVSKEKKEIAEQWFKKYFTEGDLDVLDALTTEDFVYHSRNGQNSKEQMKKFMGWYRNVFKDDEWELEDLIEQGDKLVIRYTGWMTYTGGWFNVPAENQRVKETGIIIFTIKGGKVQEMWCENSDAAILYELGAFPKDTHEIF